MRDNPELRQDIVSREWILLAPGRGRRPQQFEKKNRDKPTPKKSCPFENPQASGNAAPLVWYSKAGKEIGPVRSDWILQVIPNKYPAVSAHIKGSCPTTISEGIYAKMAGIGFHEIIIPRSHTKFLSDMNAEEGDLLIRAYQDRFLWHTREKCLEYIFVFHNHGSAAGASVWHPHSQIIALPIVPPDIARSLAGAKLYWHEFKKCVHCRIVEWEQKQKERLIYENREFVVVAPFASHMAFEMRIFPRYHEAHFEKITSQGRLLFADALTTALRTLKRVLKNPPFNFFIHTAPLGDGVFDYYHWHVEILPKTAHHAGVELGTGIEVVTMAPEEAAAYLRAAR